MHDSVSSAKEQMLITEDTEEFSVISCLQLVLRLASQISVLRVQPALLLESGLTPQARCAGHQAVRDSWPALQRRCGIAARRRSGPAAVHFRYPRSEPGLLTIFRNVPTGCGWPECLP